MALITTIEGLKTFIPALAGIREQVDTDPFANFSKDLDTANAFIKNELIGATIYGKLDANPTIKALCTAVEAYKAAISFIPQNDLVLTESGFAVMSTTNQAPASKERVERLINTIKDSLAQSIESLQIALEDSSELRTDWQGVKYCSYLPEFICNTNRVFKSYAIGYAGESINYVALKPQLMQARSILIKKLGNAFYQDLITNPTSEANARIIDDIRMLFALIVMWRGEDRVVNTNELFAYLIKNIADYPLFAAHYGTPERWANNTDNRVIVFGTPRS